MPELPEVETVLRTLELRIKDQCINDIDILWDKIIVGDIKEFKDKLIGQHFRVFKRRGKYLLFELDDYVLVSHLRMEGKYYLQDFNDEIVKHEHVIFTLDNLSLRYHDTRKFGRMEIIEKQYDYNNFKNLGVEPFTKEFNKEYIKEYINNNNKPIKQVLLDQRFIAGIGNIYADEILFEMKVNPNKKTSTLTNKNINDLILYTNSILLEAIKKGGTTIRSYTSSLGVNGLFQLELKVHTKENKPCIRCSNLIKKIKVNQRGTYYCDKCQK